jgi:signal peptidase I
MVFFVLILVIFIIARLAFCVVNISGSSMEPAFYDNECVIVLRWWPAKLLRRGQIIVARLPWRAFYAGFPDEIAHRPLNYKVVPIIKRVRSLPGETVTVHLSDVNSELRLLIAKRHDENGNRVWYVPADHYFIQGDTAGFDSCVWGPISAHDVIGVVLVKILKR